MARTPSTATPRTTPTPKAAGPSGVLKKARAMAKGRWKAPDKTFTDGLEMRRAMWGAGGADDQINNVSDFMWPMQDYVTRYCFGETWTREALSPKIRSMLTLGMLVAYGRPNEIRTHVQGAVANGCSPEEISEVMLHAMIYCGVPKAVEGFRVAAETLREMGYDA